MCLQGRLSIEFESRQHPAAKLRGAGATERAPVGYNGRYYRAAKPGRGGDSRAQRDAREATAGIDKTPPLALALLAENNSDSQSKQTDRWQRECSQQSLAPQEVSTLTFR